MLPVYLRNKNGGYFFFLFSPTQAFLNGQIHDPRSLFYPSLPCHSLPARVTASGPPGPHDMQIIRSAARPSGIKHDKSGFVRRGASPGLNESLPADSRRPEPDGESGMIGVCTLISPRHERYDNHHCPPLPPTTKKNGGKMESDYYGMCLCISEDYKLFGSRLDISALGKVQPLYNIKNSVHIMGS